MRIIVLSPLLYHPDCGNGGGVICYRFLQGLAEYHQIAFVGFSELEDVDRRSSIAALSKVCEEVVVVDLPSVPYWTRVRWRAAQWLGGAPVDTRVFNSQEMMSAIALLSAHFKPDIALLQFPYMAQYAESFGAVPTVMDVQDVFFVSRLREYDAQRRRLSRFKRMVSWLAWTRYEMKWYRRCSVLMALSDQDRAALHALLPDMPTFTSVAAVPARDRAVSISSTRERIGFVGNFGHPPNLDGLHWLSEEIVPRLVKYHPKVEICVAGRGVPAELASRLHPAIKLLGFVEDFDGFVQSCSLMIAPLRFGGGVKIKVLEALANARPVVTTSIGAEGILLDAAAGLHVADDSDCFASAIAEHLADPVPQLSAAREGARSIAEVFGVDSKVRHFESAIGRLLRISVPATSNAAHRPTLAEGHS